MVNFAIVVVISSSVVVISSFCCSEIQSVVVKSRQSIDHMVFCRFMVHLNVLVGQLGRYSGTACTTLLLCEIARRCLDPLPTCLDSPFFDEV